MSIPSNTTAFQPAPSKPIGSSAHVARSASTEDVLIALTRLLARQAAAEAVRAAIAPAASETGAAT